MFLPLQEGAIEALSSPQSWFDTLNEVYKQRRNYVWNILEELDCEYNKDQSGMFVWGRIPENGGSSIDYSDKILLRSSVFITPGVIFGSQGKNYLRISLCSNVEVFKEALNRIKNNLIN